MSFTLAFSAIFMIALYLVVDALFFFAAGGTGLAYSCATAALALFALFSQLGIRVRIVLLASSAVLFSCPFFLWPSEHWASVFTLRAIWFAIATTICFVASRVYKRHVEQERKLGGAP